VFAETEKVVTVNVAVLAPAATVTVGGTEATPAFALESVTTAPPDGAIPVNVTVPVDVLPLGTDVGLKVRVELTALVTVSTALCTPLYVAEIVTPVGDATPDVLTVNVPLVEPPAIVMEAGTVAIAVLFDDRVTTAPDAGAFDASVTVPVEEFPPRTEVGFNATPDTTGALTVNTTVFVAS